MAPNKRIMATKKSVKAKIKNHKSAIRLCAMTANDDYIIEILKDVGLIKPEQIEAAKAAAGGQQIGASE